MTTRLTVSLSGRFPLNSTEIDRRVRARIPGVYVLSRGGTRADYVGRSDTDLRSRLKDYLDSTYAYFWYAEATSARDSFEKECNLFHDLKPTDNAVHPRRPANCGWRCPRCSAYQHP